MAPTPTPNPRGLYCPECKAHRLFVRSSSRPCPGVKIRYYVCTACGCHARGREVLTAFIGRSVANSPPPPARLPPKNPRKRGPKPPRRRAA